MKVLSIGNSFSSDGTRYLHAAAKSDCYDIKTVNLFIGGCSLATHYKNMNNDAANYDLEFNGESTGFKVSIREALQSDDWDVVTMQQVSSCGVDYDTFVPYLDALDKYVSFHAPKAVHMLQQTWSYEEGCDFLKTRLDYDSTDDMFRDVKKTYETASAALGNVLIIPSGETMKNLRDSGSVNVYRDPIHAGLGTARYALALTWYEILSGKSCLGNKFRDFDENVSEEDVKIAQECAHSAASAYKKL